MPLSRKARPHGILKFSSGPAHESPLLRTCPSRSVPSVTPPSPPRLRRSRLFHQRPARPPHPHPLSPAVSLLPLFPQGFPAGRLIRPPGSLSPSSCRSPLGSYRGGRSRAGQKAGRKKGGGGLRPAAGGEGSYGARKGRREWYRAGGADGGWAWRVGRGQSGRAEWAWACGKPSFRMSPRRCYLRGQDGCPRGGQGRGRRVMAREGRA